MPTKQGVELELVLTQALKNNRLKNVNPIIMIFRTPLFYFLY